MLFLFKILRDRNYFSNFAAEKFKLITKGCSLGINIVEA